MQKFYTTFNRLFPRGNFLRGAVLLAGGQAFGQAVVVLTTPILTRLYTPEDLGAAFVFLAMFGTFVLVTSLRYDIAIPLPEDETVAANLLALALVIVPGVCFVAGVVLIVAEAPILALLNIPQFQGYLWLLAVAMFVGGLYQAFNGWTLRQKAFRHIAQATFSQNTSQAAVHVGLGLIWATPLVLVMGYIVGQVMSAALLLRFVWRERAVFSQVSAAGMWYAFRRYWRFSVFSTPSAVINSLGLRVAPILLTVFYGAAVTGWFSVAYRLAALPVALIAGSISQAFYTEASRLIHTDRPALNRLYYRMVARLFVLAMVLAVGLYVLAPPLIGVILGEDWIEVGVYLQYISFLMVAQLLASAFALAILNVFELPHWLLAWDTIRVLTTSATLAYAFANGNSPRDAVALYSVVMIINYLALFLINAYVIRYRKV